MVDEGLLFVDYENWKKFLLSLSRNYRILTTAGQQDYFWQEFKNDFSFSKYRAITSIRQFFTASKEIIDTYFSPLSDSKKSYCIVGAKACDLVSLYILDYCFLADPIDSNYQNLRSNNFIISSDCTDFKEVCFCLALDIKPYPENLFDLNISELKEGYLVEVATEKANNVIRENKTFFQEAKDTHIAERERVRKDLINRLNLHLQKLNLPEKTTLYTLIKENYLNPLWQEEALRCVECGACIMNCPTCHCFLLFDEKQDNRFIRARIWDGCQYKNFSRVAGGANPLKFRAQRLRNRYIKKFEFFYERIKRYACTGCGRCVESCIAKIDIREIFKKLAESNQEAKT